MGANKDLLDEDFFTESKPSGRPVFLTVLCILTFVGCGLVFLLNILAFWQFIRGYDLTGGIDSQLVELTISVGSIVLCLAGAILMMRLRKAGFFLYLTGEITPLIYSLFVIGPAGIFEGLDVANFAAYFIPVAFIVMYSMNYKYLR